MPFKKKFHLSKIKFSLTPFPKSHFPKTSFYQSPPFPKSHFPKIPLSRKFNFPNREGRTHKHVCFLICHFYKIPLICHFYKIPFIQNPIFLSSLPKITLIFLKSFPKTQFSKISLSQNPTF